MLDSRITTQDAPGVPPFVADDTTVHDDPNQPVVAQDHQAPTVEGKGVEPTRRVGLIGRLVKGAVAIGVAVAVAVGGMFMLGKFDAQPQKPVVPIEAPVQAPGQLPDSTAPPIDVDTPIRTPTLPSSGEGQGVQNLPTLNPIQLQGPDGARIGR